MSDSSLSRQSSSRLARLGALWPAWLATAVLLPHAWVFNFVNDDAYISFRYAKNLAEHGELVFNLGERVEGYTNFLWTVILAGAMKLGFAPEHASRVLGTACAIATLVLVTRASRRLDGRTRPGHVVAPLGLALSSAFACWCTGGLETQLFTLLVTAGALRYLDELATDRGATSGLLFALAALTRPEGALFFALAAVHRAGWNLVRERRLLPRKHEVVWAGLFALIYLPYFAWRWRYYGWPFPNTFYVKSSARGDVLAFGLHYLRRLAEDHALWFLAPLALLGWPRRDQPRHQALFAWASLSTIAFLAYAVKVGGDFMGLYRFVLPIFPVGALVVQEALRRIGARSAASIPRPAFTVALVLGLGGYAAAAFHTTRTNVTFIGADHGIDTPGYLKHYADERIPVGRWFAQHAKPDDLMTVGGAGVIPYESGIRAYDVFGLVDETIAHDPAMTVNARPGHQKWGSDAYMLSRKPTLITHVYRLHGAGGDNAAYWESHGYEWVTAEIPGLAAPPLYSFLKRIDRAFGPFPARAPRVGQSP